jgi:hypothetical protein
MNTRAIAATPVRRHLIRVVLLFMLLPSTACRNQETPPSKPRTNKPEPQSSKVRASAPAGSLAGYLEIVDEREIAGWAWDSSKPDSACQVEIYDGDSLVTTVSADAFREDLLKGKIGDGKHGFFVRPTPARFVDGKPHSVRAKIAGTSFELTDSPMKVTLKSP